MRKSVPVQADALRRRSGLSLDQLAVNMGYRRASSIQRYFAEADFRGEWLPPSFTVKLAKALVGLGSPPIAEAEVLSLAGTVFTDTGSKAIPVISFVQAGHWSEAVDAYSQGHGFDSIAVDSQVGPRAFALEFKGTSMLSRFQEGDRGVFDPDVEPIPGDYVVAKLDGENEATFKQYRPRGMDAKKRPIIELKPLNDAWPTIIIDANNPGRIIAPLIEHHSYRKTQ